MLCFIAMLLVANVSALPSGYGDAAVTVTVPPPGTNQTGMQLQNGTGNLPWTYNTTTTNTTISPTPSVRPVSGAAANIRVPASAAMLLVVVGGFFMAL